jgi:2',3'-cyclic-nucleotide 2'-phosphodiesterase (5'-nucleotidase family)
MVMEPTAPVKPAPSGRRDATIATSRYRTMRTTGFRRASLLALLLALAGCGSNGGAAEDAGTGPQEDAGADATPDASRRVSIVVIHTTDEHGYLQPFDTSGYTVGGAANLYGWLKENAGYDPARHLLVSSGDCWTGAAISTWFQGEPVVDVMNLMGYRSQAIGNHDFDFGQDTLRARQAQAGYPLLSANIRFTATGEQVDFAVPYTLTTVDGVSVGIIGLTTPDTATAANPALVSNLTFDPLYETLVAVVPEVRAAGAQVVLVTAHAPLEDLVALAGTLPEHVDAFFAGHSHGFGARTVNGVPVVVSGSELMYYSVVTLNWDRETQAVVDAGYRQETVAYLSGDPNPVTPDPGVLAVVAQWQARTDEALSEVLGYTATGIPAGSWPQGNWIVDSWRWAFPEADVAITNGGGIRASIPAGDVTLESIVTMLPFDNVILGVSITGAQLVDEVGRAAAACSAWGGCWPVVSGITYTGTGSSTQVTLASGTAVDAAATYRVLITDYLYNGGDGYGFQDYDPAPVEYGVNYRDPVVSWTRQLGTSSTDPLEAHLDATVRAQ